MIGFTASTASTVDIRQMQNYPANSNNPATKFVWANLTCPPGASSLANCAHNALVTESCETPYVHCLLPVLPTEGFQWRLMGGAVPSAGRVEMRPSAAHEWGTVSNRGWASGATTQHMLVWLCAVLGYPDGRSRYRFTATYGQGTGMVWLGETTACPTSTSDTSSFLACVRNSLGTSQQTHAFDLGLECEAPAVVPPLSAFEFRKFAITTTRFRIDARERYVEGSEWGRIHQTAADPLTLATACKEIGLFSESNNKATFINNVNTNKNRSMPTKFYNIRCTHRADSFADCTFDPSSYLNSDYDALYADLIVECNPARGPPTDPAAPVAYRLFNGSAEGYTPEADGTGPLGRLEMRRSATGPWLTMSDAATSAQWITYHKLLSTTMSICRTIGYPYHYDWARYGFLHLPPMLLPQGTFGGPSSDQTTEIVPMSGLYCQAGGYGEQLWSGCTVAFASTVTTYNPAKTFAVDCRERLFRIADASFRLNFSFSPQVGIVEVRPSAAVGWGTVNVRDEGVTPPHVMRALCRSAAGGLGPANWATQTRLQLQEERNIRSFIRMCFGMFET